MPRENGYTTIRVYREDADRIHEFREKGEAVADALNRVLAESQGAIA